MKQTTTQNLNLSFESIKALMGVSVIYYSYKSGVLNGLNTFLNASELVGDLK